MTTLITAKVKRQILIDKVTYDVPYSIQDDGRYAFFILGKKYMGIYLDALEMIKDENGSLIPHRCWNGYILAKGKKIKEFMQKSNTLNKFDKIKIVKEIAKGKRVFARKTNEVLTIKERPHEQPLLATKEKALPLRGVRQLD